MKTQIERAHLLRSLHIKGTPLILFNIWDAGSARAIQDSGAKVIATSSWSVAASHGYDDGEKLAIDWVLANLKRIIASVDLPVTIDLEGGYGKNSSEVCEIVTKVIEAGAVGINFEDQVIGGPGLYSIDDQCERIRAIREVAQRMEVPIFINARTDIFFKVDPASHNGGYLEDAVNRACAYAEAGADGFFVPGLMDTRYIEQLCELSPIPVNIMLLSDVPRSRELGKLGVARISYGPSPYCQMMDTLKEAGRKVFAEY